MFRQNQQSKNHGTVDGGEGRGVPLGGHDERPPTGYRSEDEPELGWDANDDEDDDGRERRRDPLRKI
ncbi:MAG TPA: hypothetical protein VKB93_12745 [Thermoanaerobaculia bacterium]|nr:hypothetical protein [Thermoanaerobaculia bacterium]